MDIIITFCPRFAKSCQKKDTDKNKRKERKNRHVKKFGCCQNWVFSSPLFKNSQKWIPALQTRVKMGEFACNCRKQMGTYVHARSVLPERIAIVSYTTINEVFKTCRSCIAETIGLRANEFMILLHKKFLLFVSPVGRNFSSIMSLSINEYWTKITVVELIFFLTF